MTALTSPTPDRAAPIASLAPLAAVFGIALVSAMALAWGAADVMTWNQRVESVSITASALMGVLAVGVGVVCGLAMLWSPGARSTRLIGMRIMAAGATRLLVTLFLALILLVAARPEAYTFFTALTLAAAACMLAELAWGVSALRRHAGGEGSATPISPGASAQ
jgi:hypothetical protein